MELTWCQVEEVGLKAAFILQGSRERHKVVIGSRSKWKFLSLPPKKKHSVFCPTKLILHTECPHLAENSVPILPAARSLFRFFFF